MCPDCATGQFSSIYTVHNTVNTAGSQKHGVKGNELGCNLESVSVFP